ncbi:hypothetical protein EJ08DRAFT_647955 [Tothia fuscella]|uniref:Uncharacterized protein n=1 Tax=Tothia fuscella TaxID=1048955 RepID=A0A9P4TZG8_9PEZI|nr:hypothetical protein EJ08DRAFT_647955 [Tothia fuscella]
MADDPDETKWVRRLIQTHKTPVWGFVIYRCTYEDDKAWSKFMQIMKFRAHERLRLWEEAEFEVPVTRLIETLDWNVREDRLLFDGATKSFVRDHFREWITSREAVQEQELVDESVGPLVEQEDEQDLDYFNMAKATETRYKFAVHVDADALDSIINRAPQPPEYDYGVGFVNLIQKDWYMPEPGDENDPVDEGEEPIEGCRRHDVGWMKVAIENLNPGIYTAFRDPAAWYVEYVRPPGIGNW